MRATFTGLIIGLLALWARAETTAAPHVTVNYEGIDANQATAIAKTLSAAWKVYIEDYGFDMPDMVTCLVKCDEGQPTQLFTDGNDHVTLSVPNKQKLDQPGKSGVFNLYGMCHEMGHMAMYRTLKDRDWMSSAAAEGWAHYAGSVVVDRVYELEGGSLWADPYDYRADGMQRLKKQLAGASPPQVALGAGQWLKLEEIVGKKGFAGIFKAWQSAGVDATRPDDALLKAAKLADSKQAEKLDAWWKPASSVLVQKRQASVSRVVTLTRDRLSGNPTKLEPDDGSADGQRSIAGGGHARKFSTPEDGEWYITAVSVFGARYGPMAAPSTQFDIGLCEPDLKTITLWKKGYALFKRGDMGWVRIEVPPTRVPKNFAICLNFRPTASNGVYVGMDSSTSGNSQVGTPGRAGSPLGQGDWMIRVELDQPKGADALK